MQPPNASQPPSSGQQRQIRVELPAHLGVTYANAAIVTQTHSEIVLDFVQVMPNAPSARIQSRIVMTPANAKCPRRYPESEPLRPNTARSACRRRRLRWPATSAASTFRR
jgi:hypothetical protein